MVALGILTASMVAAIPVSAAASTMTITAPTSVANGATFNVTVAIAAGVPVAGAQATITFDNTKVAYVPASVATIFASNLFAAEGQYNVPVTTTANSVTIASTTGGGPAVTPSGTWATLKFTAITTNTATAFGFAQADSFLSDAGANSVFPNYVTATTIIGTPPTADLTVSGIAANFDGAHGTNATTDPAQYTVSFTVNNLGNLASTATTANVVVDGAAPVAVTVPIIANGANTVATSATIILTGTFDNITVTVDPANTVLESNEANNSGSIQASYQYPVPGQKTDINGGIVGTISFTQPTALTLGSTAANGFGMQIGNNSVSGTLNVKTNQSWLVSTQGMAPVTTTGAQANTDAGRMTRFDIASTTYNAYIKLHQNLHVITTGGYLTGYQVGPTTFVTPTNADVTLTGTAQPLAFGIPEGQQTSTSGTATLGEDRTMTFAQTVQANDAALATGAEYHIVVNFTVAVTPW